MELSATTRKLLLKLFYAAGSVDKTFFACICGVGICGHIARNHIVIYAVNVFNLLALHSGAREKTGARRYVHKTDWMEVGMDILFHSGFAPKLINPASP